MKFAEELPSECPPTDAQDQSLPDVWRTLPSQQASSGDFDSHAKLGIYCPPGVDPCRAASCSLMTNQAAAEKLLQLPRYKNGSVAQLEIPKGSGLSKTKKQHIDFWAYSGFNFLDAIKRDTND